MAIKQCPMTFCVNLQKTTRENLMKALEVKYNIITKKSTNSIHGLEVVPFSHHLMKLNPFKTTEYLKKGFFEKQYEAVQVALKTLEIHSDDRILDLRPKLPLKSLTLGSMYKGLSIYIFEEKEKNINLYQSLFERNSIPVKIIKSFERLQDFQGKFDWVLIDAPNSETGLIHEIPEVKLKFNYDALDDLVNFQSSLLNQGAKYMKKLDGKLIYFTNSLLKKVR